MFELIRWFHKAPYFTTGLCVTWLGDALVVLTLSQSHDYVFYAMFSLTLIPVLFGLFLQFKIGGGFKE